MTTSNPAVNLHRWGRDGADLTEAARAVFANNEPIAFLQARRPTVCRFLNGAFQGPDGAVDAGTIYRADVFDHDRHLRWYRPQGSGPARAVVLTEGAAPIPGFDDHQSTRCVPVSQQYLLWRPPPSGAEPGMLPSRWGWAREARTAPFAVPIDHDPATRTKLDVYEYISVDTAEDNSLDGNAFVIDERFCALSQAEGPGGEQLDSGTTQRDGAPIDQEVGR